ncbi:caspase family protein [Streptomyces sp. NPDC005485]|uniref:HD domain-containing protein n=1 Tax=Streptomyces sp. NPDC005485 TaxID=3155591 RepID=UPI0033B1EA38
MERARKALLIGVGHAPATVGLLEPLDEVVEADLRLMNTALEAAGYEVETLHDAGLSRIKPKIYEVARDVPPGGTLLLYFTGHGVRVDGVDHLVPADATPPRDGVWQEPYVDSLLPARISPLLKECRAGTVLWLVDACRTVMDGKGVAFGNSIDSGPPEGGFAVLTGCSAGEQCGHTSEGSFFTRGLADALGPLAPARTVHEVFTAARARTKEAARRHGLTQTAGIRYGTNAEAETREKEICGGRPLLEAWLEAARQTPLWERVKPEDQGSVPAFQDSLADFVGQCARTLHLAQQRLPHPDPWADDAFPVRLLRDRLPLLLPEAATLSAVEVALLVAAPFLREAAWADRLSQAAEIDPYAGERRPGADAHRRHYEQMGDQHARVARKAAQCRARDRVQDEAAVTMWLVHRWIADRFETDDEAVPPGPAQALVTALGVAQDRVHELSGLLCALASGIGLEDLPGELPAASRGKVLLPGGHQTLRVRPLAALLRLAAALAVDVRTFPEAVAEHLAVTDPVLPEQVIGTARDLGWDRDGDALHLDALCPHQAVHAALTEVVDQADQLTAQVMDLSAELPESEAALLTAVPRRVTDRGLRPSRIGNQPSYEVPLLRFHLAQTEVRELLMGEQLYGGEPQLALRELYQNAMDACRYRAMRWTFLHSSGVRPADWTGRITFTQGEDERGRYVECQDNGVGMSAEQLKHTFTRAGSRFERSKSFRKEQSRWLRHDPSLRLYPNSRFGIGVFSYFMLADEMTIVTRQVSPDGVLADHALRVDIPSSGSLFRIQRLGGAQDGLAEGGTRVRLYLRDGAGAAGLSCVKVLRELVRVSEFRLEARDGTGYAHDWVPGALQSPPGPGTGSSLEAVPGVLWWVTGEGAILCDGIVTDQEPFGCVLNLTGPHAGKLSVSRKELQEFDQQWADETWRQGAKALVDWPSLSLNWLWELDARNLSVAQVLDQEWRGKGVEVRGRSGRMPSLDVVGWFHLDRDMYDDQRRGNQRRLSAETRRFQPWRTAALQIPAAAGMAAAPLSLSGHPVPAPGDADLANREVRSWHEVVSHAAGRGMTVAEVLLRLRRLRIVHPVNSPPPTTGEDLAWVPDALDGELAQALEGWAKTRRSSARAFDEGGVDDCTALVLASAQLSMPMGLLARRLARFAPLHSLTVPAPPEHHENYVCTEDDIAGLFSEPSDAPSRRQRRVDGARQVREICGRTGEPLSEVLRRLSDFSWLGWRVPSPDELSAWMELDSDVFDVLGLFTWGLPDGRRSLCWAATINFADIVQVDLETAERELGTVAARLGLVHEPRYSNGLLDGRHIPSYDASLLLRQLAAIGVRLEDGINLDSLALASPSSSDFDLETALEDLRAAGVPLPDGLGILTSWRELPLRSRSVLSGKDVFFDEEDYAAAGMTSAALLNAAAGFNEPLHEVWLLAAREAIRFGLAVPPLPETVADYRPPQHVCWALTSRPDDAYGNSGTAIWRRLPPEELVKHAHRQLTDARTAYEEFCRLRVIGALVPELPQHAVDALSEHIPDGHDLIALSAEYRVSDSDTPPTPLDLVSVAGRLGEPITDTVRRITPYLPFWSGAAELPPAADTIPLWQDLALLSRHFDGQLPAVSGRVTLHHVKCAAESVGESEEWVRERLRRYAVMFDLDVDEPAVDAEDDEQTRHESKSDD